MGDTAEAIRTYLAALADALVAGLIDRNTADVLQKLARGGLAATKHIDEGSRLARYEAAVARAEALQKAGEANMITDRQHQGKPKAVPNKA